MAAVSGRYSGSAAYGFTHTNRWHCRWSRSSSRTRAPRVPEAPAVPHDEDSRPQMNEPAVAPPKLRETPANPRAAARGAEDPGRVPGRSGIRPARGGARDLPEG